MNSVYSGDEIIIFIILVVYTHVTLLNSYLFLTIHKIIIKNNVYAYETNPYNHKCFNY